MIATTTIHQAHITIGAAWDEGRAPNTDAEHLTLYWRPSDGPEGDWVLEDNAGLHCTSFGVNDIAADYAEEGGEEEWKRIYTEVRESLGTKDGNLCLHSGAAAADCMIEWGWVIDEGPDTDIRYATA